MDGERGDVVRPDDASDWGRGAELVPPRLQPSSEADSGVSTKPAAMRSTRTGAMSRAAVSVGIASLLRQFAIGPDRAGFCDVAISLRSTFSAST